MKAARVLLSWQQRDLATAADLSMTAINNFERGSGVTRERTILAMRNALENGGIEFLPGSGLRRSDDIAQVTRFSGEDFIKK